MKNIRVEYYALLREERGEREEVVQTQAPSVKELYEELRERHSFSLACAQLSVAVNGSFVSWDTVLRDGDTVIFIPPVAGG